MRAQGSVIIIAVSCVALGSVMAQDTAPQVTSILNAASGMGALGEASIATISGTNLSGVSCQASTTPYRRAHQDSSRTPPPDQGVVTCNSPGLLRACALTGP